MLLAARPPPQLQPASRMTAVRPLAAASRPIGRRRGSGCCARAQAEDLQEWDIVLYDAPDGSPALGRVSQIAADGSLSVERLEEDAVNGVWVVEHGEARVAAGAVRRTVAADYLQMVDPDRISNPHGEHALEAYRLLEPVGRAAAGAAALGGGSNTSSSGAAAGEGG